MKKLIQLIAIFIIVNANAQIGGGWDWAFNTGTLGGATYKHLKYTADGSEILMAGQCAAAAYFGGTTLTAPPPTAGNPGNIRFFGKINAATGVPTIIRSFNNIPLNFDCVTTDDAGNFYTGGAFVAVTDFDLGNGVIIPAAAFKMNVIVKFDATGNAIWAKTFSMGAIGAANNVVFKLAVSNAGNIFFTGLNFNTNNRPLYKLDNNGNTIWFKDASGAGIGTSNNPAYLSDQFIDDNENVHYFVYGTGTAGLTFDGVSYPGGNATIGYSTLISLNSGGTVFNAQTYAGAVSHFRVDRTSGNMSFCWNQLVANGGPFAVLPFSYASISPGYAFYAKVFMQMDKNLNFIKAKDLLVNNPFALGTDDATQYINLPNGKLLISTNFAKTVNYSAGVNSFYPAEPINYSTALLETDSNWDIIKFISGGKAPYTSQSNIAVFNNTFLIAAGFNSAAPGFTSTNLPTTSFGTVSLTGMNAAANITTAYGSFSNFRTDVALAQCKSENFPNIASTTWLGTTNNWNTPSNWTNGVPTNAMKAVFSAPTPFYPTTSATPTAATLEVLAGVSLPLPTTLALIGGLKNDGTIVLNDAGFFQGLGANEWKGAGSVNFTGANTNFYFDKAFTNSLVVGTNLTSFYNVTVPNITFTSGKFNLNTKKISITNSGVTAITGTSNTSYFYGGTLERAINPTGNYEFALGTAATAQPATIVANSLLGTNKIATTFTSGSITGTVPNIAFGGTTIATALDAGFYSIAPNAQPTSGTYNVSLKVSASTNLVASAAKYTVIKRDNATAPWAVQGGYTLASTLGGTVTATNTGLTTFSDFAIGIANQDVVLSSDSFSIKPTAIKLYPNPTSNNLNLSFENNLENAAIKIISLTGQTVFEKQNLSGTDFNLDASNLSLGVYIIKITDGETTFTNKFIKN